MATYVNDLRLKEIATGDESGTWGTSTNTNLELIADAFSYATKDCFATDADATETMADGVADEIRSLYLKVTSSATLTATRTLTLAPNTVSKTWIIENATTGGQSISISQGSGANVTIPNGDTKIIYTDGAGAGATVTDAFANLNVGDLTATNITGTLATAAQPNITSVGTLTGLDVAGTPTFDGLTVVGSGSNIRYDVASSNPHTNPILHLENQNTTDGNVAALMLSADNANGVGGSAYIYAQSETTNQKGNLVFAREDGANTPVTSMKLSSNGDISFYEDTGTTAKLFWDASAESLTVGGTGDDGYNLNVESAADTSLSVFSSTNPSRAVISTHSGNEMRLESRGGGAASILTMYTGAIGSPTERLRIDSSGQVGIGTTSPSATLDLGAGDLRFTGGAGQDIVWGSASTDYAAIRRIDPASQDVGLSFHTTTNAGVDGSPERMRIDSSGNVGIGTSSPSVPLEVAGNIFINTSGNPNLTVKTSGAGNNPNIRIQADTNYWDLQTLFSNANDELDFRYNGSSKMIIDSSGNVGIGTSSPAAPLHVQGNSYLIGSGYGVYGNNDAANYSIFNSATGGFLDINWYGGIKFLTNGGSERMRITSGGEVCINTSATSQGANLAVQGDTMATGSNSTAYGSQLFAQSIRATANGNNDTESACFLGMNVTSGAVNRPAFQRCYDNESLKFQIANNGNVTNTNGSYGSISDRRYKQDIVDANSQWDDIKAIQVRNYRFIDEVEEKGDDATTLLGVVAQELEEAGMTGLVESKEDQPKTVKTSIIFMKALKALQEAQIKIETLESKVAALESA